MVMEPRDIDVIGILLDEDPDELRELTEGADEFIFIE